MTRLGIVGAALGVVLFIGGSAEAQCPHIGYLTCVTQGSNIEISWTPPANSYNQITVLRDGTPIATIDGQLTSYLDSPAPGVYNYSLTSDCGAVSFPCLALSAVTATFSVDAVSATPGSTVQTWVRTSSANCIGVTGGSFGISHDPTLLTIAQLEVTGNLAAINLANGPSVQFPNIDPVSPAGMAGLSFGFITDISPPIDQLVPAGSGVEILTITYVVHPNATEGSSSALEFTELLGDPPVAVRIAVDNLLIVPTSPPQAGAITIISPSSALFVRGDTNLDGNVTLIDAIQLLSFLFLAEELGCHASADFQDDGALNLLDAIQTLSYLFVGGSPLPAQPFPACGADSTPSALECLSSATCA